MLLLGSEATPHTVHAGGLLLSTAGKSALSILSMTLSMFPTEVIRCSWKRERQAWFCCSWPLLSLPLFSLGVWPLFLRDKGGEFSELCFILCFVFSFLTWFPDWVSPDVVTCPYSRLQALWSITAFSRSAISFSGADVHSCRFLFYTGSVYKSWLFSGVCLWSRIVIRGLQRVGLLQQLAVQFLWPSWPVWVEPVGSILQEVLPRRSSSRD